MGNYIPAFIQLFRANNKALKTVIFSAIYESNLGLRLLHQHARLFQVTLNRSLFEPAYLRSPEQKPHNQAAAGLLLKQGARHYTEQQCDRLLIDWSPPPIELSDAPK